MRVRRLAWLGIRTEAAEALAEFFANTLGLRLDHADDNGWVFVLPGGGKVEVDGRHVADWQHFTTGPVAGFLVDDVVAATEELKRGESQSSRVRLPSTTVLRGFTSAAPTGTCLG